MELAHAKRILEGLLFVSGQPVTLKRLKEVLAELDDEPLRRLIGDLQAEYQQSRRAFRIQEVAGGYRLVTDPELSPWVKRLLQLPREDTVSKPALETLAIIAYRQPLTKAEIEAIRGVDGTATLETLLERQFVRVLGRKDTPGRPLLYGTTDEFLRHFGLKRVEDLPPIPHGSTEIPGLTTPPDASVIHDPAAPAPAH